MTIHEVICTTCGAINRDGTEPCWRCREALDPAPAVNAPAAAVASTG
jgi:hypothetical protein